MASNVVLSNQEYSVVGTRPIRHDGVDKVTGRAQYSADINLPGLLHGKVLRSPHAHARIKSIDATRALALPGVRAVVTSALTIEGMADGDRLHPLQQSFIDNAAFQCGFCTPGMILAAKALLDETPQPPQPTADQVKEYMQGNICRCTGYKKIVEAILSAAG